MSSQQYLDNMYKLGAMGMSLMNQNRQNAAYQEAQQDKKQYKTAMGLVTTPMSTSALAQANQNITEGDYKGLGSPWNADLRKSAMNYIPAGEDAVKQEVANALGIQPAFVKAQTDYANSQTAIGNAKKIGLELQTAESEKRIRELSGQFWGTMKSGGNPADLIQQAQKQGFSDIEIHKAQGLAASEAYQDEETRGKLLEKQIANGSVRADRAWKAKESFEFYLAEGNNEAAQGALDHMVEMMPNYYFVKNEDGTRTLMFDDPYDNEEPSVVQKNFSVANAVEFIENKTKKDFAIYFANAEMAEKEANINSPVAAYTDTEKGDLIKGKKLTKEGKTFYQLYDYNTGKSLGEPVAANQFRGKYVVYDEKAELTKQKELAEINRTKAQTDNYKAQAEYTRGAKTDNAGGKGKDLTDDKLLNMAIAYLGQDNLATMDAETRKIAILGALNDLSSIFDTGGTGGGATAEDEILTYFDRNGKVNNGKGEPKPVPRPSNVLAEIKSGEEEETEESWLEKFDRKMKSLGRGNVSFADLEKKRTADGNWHIGLKD